MPLITSYDSELNQQLQEQFYCKKHKMDDDLDDEDNDLDNIPPAPPAIK